MTGANREVRPCGIYVGSVVVLSFLDDLVLVGLGHFLVADELRVKEPRAWVMARRSMA